MTCLYDDNPVLNKKRQLCSQHYYRVRKYNDPHFTKHTGATKDNRYWCYQSMLRRCYLTTHPFYKYYGGRGITVCERWLGPDGFKNFCEDMGPRSSFAYSLDRIEHDGNYEPGNCKWSTRFEQGNNRRNNHAVPGVSARGDKWLATICFNGERHSKMLNTYEEAVETRKGFERKYVKVPA